VNKEELIREARTTEAMKKGYMGLEGKLAVIAKFLGDPIIQQGGKHFDQTFLEDFYELPDENEIQEMSEDESSYEIGLQFDGLSRGFNLTISVMNYLREITCRYHGQIVYREISGELEGFVPSEEWEKNINDLYNSAKKIEKNRKPIEKAKFIEEAEKRKIKIIDYLKSKWGL
jgi:hypothetical protein